MMVMGARKAVMGVLVVLVLGLAGFAGYTWVTLHWSYSRGERAGYIQKLSQKGWLCKTWEGELQMMPVPGALPEKFLFSVRGDDMAAKLNSAVGRKVSLVYEQHKGVPTACFGETEFYVVGMRVME